MANPHPKTDHLPRGRKGRPNKITKAFKTALLEAFNEIGGAEELARWGADLKNRPIFYQICARLVPTEVQGSADGPPIATKVIHEYRDKP